MAGTDAAVMLTLAGLTYRGFQDVLPGEPHEFIVRQALRDGLQTLTPLHGEWELVWGPVTSRVPLGVFDSNAMYVVRHRRARHRYVVAIRGTNPVASSDWLFGDLLVGTTVAWPFATTGAAISTSTALGLAMLQEMRARPLSTAARFAEASVSAVGHPLDRLIRAGRAWLSGTSDALSGHASSLDAQIQKIVAHWNLDLPGRDAIRQQFQLAAKTARVSSADLRRRPSPAGASTGGLDVLTFLAQQAAGSAEPLEVTVTGHSKGGALAPAVALWLKDSLRSADPAERWDGGRQARILSYAFAGPTPGNAAFADRVDQVLGADHHHLRNTNDLVTRAWQVGDLQQIPALYGSRTAALAPLLPGVIGDVQPLDYRHAQSGMVTFAGPLDPHRGLATELITQHMDAYLAHTGLTSQGIRAITFFI
jgi:Lipase (class 3)